MSDEYKAAQAELVSAHIAKQDIVITTALIPGRPAPRLITDAQLATMRPGSVIVDLAVEQGGNVEGAGAGEVVERHGVKIVGHRNVPSRLAADASALYARNLYNFLSAFWDAETKAPVLPDEDEIVQGVTADPGRQGRAREAGEMSAGCSSRCCSPTGRRGGRGRPTERRHRGFRRSASPVDRC